MNHHLSESQWQFFLDGGDASMPDEQRAAAQRHLDQCAHCQALVKAGHEVERLLRHAPAESPRPGFTTRWRERWAIAQQRRLRRQTLIVVALSLLTSFSMLGILSFSVWSWVQTPELFLWVCLQHAVDFWFKAFSFKETATAFGRAFLAAIPPVAWLFMVGALSELLVLWMVSLRIWLLPRRVRR